MSSERGPAKEMVVGTDDPMQLEDGADGGGGGVQYTALPDQDAIDCHVAIMRVVLLNDGRAIEAYDLDVIAALRDRCDRLSYWAVEEPKLTTSSAAAATAENPASAATASASGPAPSRLAAAVPLCFRMLLSPRPKVIAAGAMALAELVAMPSNAVAFLGTSSEGPSVPIPGSSATGSSSTSSSGGGTELFCGLHAVARAMAACTQHDDILARCCTLARRLAPYAIESFLGADIVALVLKAMGTHKQSSALQREAALFFATIVRIPRADPKDIPVSILMTHVGVCLPFVLHAYKFQPTSSGVAESVVEFLLTLTERPENLEEVASSNALHVLCHCATGNILVPRMVERAFAAISSLVPELDSLQKRSVAAVCFTALTKSADASVLTSSLALLLRLVDSFPSDERTTNNKAPDGSAAASAAQRPVGGDETSLDELSKFKMFATQQQIPRVVMFALQHFGDEDPVIAQMGSKLLASLCFNKFRY